LLKSRHFLFTRVAILLHSANQLVVLVTLVINSAYKRDIGLVENLAPNSGSLRADNITVSLKSAIDWVLLPR